MVGNHKIGKNTWNITVNQDVGHISFFELIDNRYVVLNELLEIAEKIADKDVIVLITGEGGTGKEIRALFIHRYSSRKKTFSSDILERVFLVSSYAIDFYVEHPEFFSLITKTHGIEDREISDKIDKYFKAQFLNIFSGADESNLNYEMSRIIEKC